MIKIGILLSLSLLSTFASAAQYQATIETGGDFTVYGPACRVEKVENHRSKRAAILEVLSDSASSTLAIKSSQLESGNCSRFAAKNMPEILQLNEGELFEASLQPKGASAISGTMDTVFYARWDRPAKDVIRVYGGCSWNYRCGRSGNSEVTITTHP